MTVKYGTSHHTIHHTAAVESLHLLKRFLKLLLQAYQVTGTDESHVVVVRNQRDDSSLEKERIPDDHFYIVVESHGIHPSIVTD